METTKEILTELQEIAPYLVKSGISHHPYALPKGYLEDFPQILMSRIKAEIDENEPNLALEMATLSPLLAGLQKKNPYQTPEGFFESWKVNLTEVASEPVSAASLKKERDTLSSPGGRMISLFSGRIYKYGLAACIVALLGLGILSITHQFVKDPLNALANISKQDMADFLNDEDVHWTPGGGTETVTASVDFNDTEIHDLFSNVPDTELEQYLPVLPSGKQTVN